MLYRINGKLLTANTLYQIAKFKSKTTKKQLWKTFAFKVDLNLEEKPNKKLYWKTVTLVFAITKNLKNDEFALFLCTDNLFPTDKILEIYSLRWRVEVYFKEVK